MIKNAKILKIYQRDIFTFNQGDSTIVIDGESKYCLNYKSIVLGTISNKLIVLVNNKYVVSLIFPSFILERVLHKGCIDSHTNSRDAIWFQKENKVFRIDSEMQISLYDDFTDVALLNLVYLQNIGTLAFIVKDKEDIKI